MKPYIFSKKKMEHLGTGWHQAGDNIEYKPRKLHYEDLLNSFFTLFHNFLLKINYL